MTADDVLRGIALVLYGIAFWLWRVEHVSEAFYSWFFTAGSAIVLVSSLLPWVRGRWRLYTEARERALSEQTTMGPREQPCP